MVWGCRSTAWDGMGKRRTPGQGHLPGAHLGGARRPGAAATPARTPRRRLREPSLQALLRELAAFNGGLCVITARLPVADLADYEGSSVLRLDLDHLSGEAGVRLLQALGVKGPEAELRHASEE